MFSYSKRKRQQAGPYQTWVQIWLHPISSAFPTCTDVLPLHRQTYTISHYLNQTVLLSLFLQHTDFIKHTFHHFIILFLSINSHFQVSPKKEIIFIFQFSALLQLPCYPSKLLTHLTTNHFYYFNHYSLLNWNISFSFILQKTTVDILQFTLNSFKITSNHFIMEFFPELRDVSETNISIASVPFLFFFFFHR